MHVTGKKRRKRVGIRVSLLYARISTKYVRCSYVIYMCVSRDVFIAVHAAYTFIISFPRYLLIYIFFFFLRSYDLGASLGSRCRYSVVKHNAWAETVGHHRGVRKCSIAVFDRRSWRNAQQRYNRSFLLIILIIWSIDRRGRNTKDNDVRVSPSVNAFDLSAQQTDRSDGKGERSRPDEDATWRHYDDHGEPW